MRFAVFLSSFPLVLAFLLVVLLLLWFCCSVVLSSVIVCHHPSSISLSICQSSVVGDLLSVVHRHSQSSSVIVCRHLSSSVVVHHCPSLSFGVLPQPSPSFALCPYRSWLLSLSLLSLSRCCSSVVDDVAGCCSCRLLLTCLLMLWHNAPGSIAIWRK